MLIQPMNAIKRLKRISQKLSSFAFGASIGIYYRLIIYGYAKHDLITSGDKYRQQLSFFPLCCRILVAVLTVCERIGDTFISW